MSCVNFRQIRGKHTRFPGNLPDRYVDSEEIRRIHIIIQGNIMVVQAKAFKSTQSIRKIKELIMPFRKEKAKSTQLIPLNGEANCVNCSEKQLKYIIEYC